MTPLQLAWYIFLIVVTGGVAIWAIVKKRWRTALLPGVLSVAFLAMFCYSFHIHSHYGSSNSTISSAPEPTEPAIEQPTEEPNTEPTTQEPKEEPAVEDIFVGTWKGQSFYYTDDMDTAYSLEDVGYTSKLVIRSDGTATLSGSLWDEGFECTVLSKIEGRAIYLCDPATGMIDGSAVYDVSSSGTEWLVFYPYDEEGNSSLAIEHRKS